VAFLNLKVMSEAQTTARHFETWIVPQGERGSFRNASPL